MLQLGYKMWYSVLSVQIGSGLALGCMILAAISYTVLRYIRKVHYSVTTFFLGVWGTVEMLILALMFDALSVPKGMEEIGLVCGLASLTFLGQCAIVLAMKAEQAGPVALVRTFDVIFGFFLQIIVLGMMPDALRYEKNL
jgi:drug/metabolite transporter (DMT)-like permease